MGLYEFAGQRTIPAPAETETIHTQFTAEHLDRGFGLDTHNLLGRRRGGFPLRVGSRPAVEGLLAELKTQWREYRRANNATVVAI